jgi:uncharacterized small protein (DUF1192 family)
MHEEAFGDRPRKAVAHEVGCDLATLSEHELQERIGLLRAEIVRLEEEVRRKAASRDAASAFFKN